MEFIKSFINDNLLSETKVLILYFFYRKHKITQLILDYINSLKGLKLKIVFFTNDFWYRHLNRPNKTLQQLFTPKNHYTLTFAQDLEQLSRYHDKNFHKYHSRIFFFNIWTAYDSSFVKFNSSPINAVAVFGSTNPVHYPERKRMLAIEGVTYLKYIRNDKSIANRLNKYVAGFASSAYVPERQSRECKNCHLLVQKYFEILASGALLICPDTERKQLNELGVRNKVNCIMIDMKDAQKNVNYILNAKNRKEIDIIREKGQKHAKEYLNSKTRYAELMDLLKTKLKPPQISSTV